MADPTETTQVSSAPAEIDATELLDAVRSLAAQVGVLQGELQALREDGAALPSGETGAHGWEDRVPTADSPAWVRALDSPSSRRPAAPRLLLEIVFLLGVAGLAALANLDALVIVGVMAVAWGLVVAVEWAVARESRLRERALLGSGTSGSLLTEDPSWFAPPVERSPLEIVPDEDARAARLPSPPD